jgi:hypothetical protein
MGSSADHLYSTEECDSCLELISMDRVAGHNMVCAAWLPVCRSMFLCFFSLCAGSMVLHIKSHSHRCVNVRTVLCNWALACL